MPVNKLFRNVCLVIIALMTVVLGVLLSPSSAQIPENSGAIEDRVNAYMAAARIDEGAVELAAELAANPQDDALRFGTGFLQFADAVENLGQSWYRYGLLSRGGLNEFFPFLRLPVPQNLVPESLSHEQFRQVLEQFVDDILLAEQTLSEVTDDTVQLGVYLGRAYLDFNNDDEASPLESLWQIYADLNRAVQITEEQGTDFLINLDAGDIQWLRGYCHLLSAALDLYLTYDDSELFDRVAHLFFQNPETPYDFLLPSNFEEFRASRFNFIDAIALVHLINFPVINPRRSEAALDHLQQTVELSRKTWQLYTQETDDDHEWIPNPNQTGVIPGAQVTPEIIDGWLSFLDETDLILAGDRLLPFWREDPPIGVNLKRVFTEPQTLDAVLWTQGTAAAPYLETGTLTDPDFWQQLGNTFGGSFFFFALWFN